MIYIENDTTCRINHELLSAISEKFSAKDIELLIVSENEMKDLNTKSRGINASTDVLSFPLEQMEHTPLGSIVINKNRVLKISNELSHTQEEEVALLFTHGLLHLLGYDHESDKGEMRGKEEEIIKEFNLPKSLIVRIEG